MTNKQPSCPKCACKLIWNGTGMTCVSCPYEAASERAKTRSERKMPTPRKEKK